MCFAFSKRSKKNLEGVNQDLIRVLERALEISPADFAVIEGVRTMEQQVQNVQKGVSKTLYSRHITGHAVDILPTAIKPNCHWDIKYFIPVLKAIKQAGDDLGVPLRFGINWKSDPTLPSATKFIDAPHVELQ